MKKTLPLCSLGVMSALRVVIPLALPAAGLAQAPLCYPHGIYVYIHKNTGLKHEMHEHRN